MTILESRNIDIGIDVDTTFDFSTGLDVYIGLKMFTMLRVKPKMLIGIENIYFYTSLDFGAVPCWLRIITFRTPKFTVGPWKFTFFKKNFKQIFTAVIFLQNFFSNFF